MITDSTYRTSATSGASESLKERLTRHVADQAASRQGFHRLLNVLELAALVPIAATFATAMYVSVNHTGVRPEDIAAAWMSLPVSAVPMVFLNGLHMIVLRASPTRTWPGGPKSFTTGAPAVWQGVALIAVALVTGVFWGNFAWTVWSGNLDLALRFTGIMATALGVLIPLAIVASILQKVLRLR